ncbi:MAG: dihydroorotate dehydrogenase-like protein [Candidatus Omnitrophica bacterium]|nr:dihydroorotate dehydrogenase-like protein [Candidatus Omnitrophota bacterium]
MGLALNNPLVASASPLSENVGNFKKLEDAGVSAIVMHSLFEEQLSNEALELDHHLNFGTESYAESLSFFPEPAEYKVGPEEYLDHIAKAKKSIAIPVIASLNGHTGGGWTKYAQNMEEAGADAIELNIYHIPTDLTESAQFVEQKYLDILAAVKAAVKIPVAVKLSPYFSNMANMAKKLDDAGADALVLFNRFYQPDIDLENLEVLPHVNLSTPQAMRLPLRWIAILHGKVGCSLAATSGIHSHLDVLKMIMVGADVTLLCSTILKNGIRHITEIRQNIENWMEEHEYESIQQMRGSLSQKNCADPQGFERAQYMKTLQSFIKF